MFEYRKATLEDLEKIWNKDIIENHGEECWVRWKKQYIEYNETGKAATFVVLHNGDPVGQISVLFSPGLLGSEKPTYALQWERSC